MTNQADARGFMVLENHTLVRLAFEKMVECNLSDFNQQNVLLSLRIEPAEPTLKGFFRVVLDTSSGLTGYILCKQLTVLDVLPCNSTGKPIL